MRWAFTTEQTLEERHSGFIIYLLSGSWEEPHDVSSKSTRAMDASEKAEYLKLGLAFAKDYIEKGKNKEEAHSY